MSLPTSPARAALAVALVLAATPASAAASGSTTDRGNRRASVPGQLSVRVPRGWHVLRGWLSDVVDPAPRLALASFPARLSRHTCSCGSPNVVRFPRDGAFAFMWEYLDPSRRALARTPPRPAHFRLADARRAAVRHSCHGPSDTLAFRDAGRVFQLEVYVGPSARPALRRRLAATLDSLRVAPATAPFALSSFSYRRALSRWPRRTTRPRRSPARRARPATNGSVDRLAGARGARPLS